MKKLSVIACMLLLGGCASSTQPEYFWKKHGTSYDEAVNAEAGCQYDVGMANIVNPVEKQKIIEACMKKDGYRWGEYIPVDKG